MMVERYFTLALSVVWTAQHLVSGAQLDEVKRLKEKLFQRYDRQIRPVLNQSEAVYMNMSLSLLVIDSLDLKSQKLKWNGFLSMNWYDQQLMWNSSDYGDTDFIILSQSDIWLPDVILNNNLYSDRTLGSPDTLVFIRNTGLVTWEPGIVTETSCKIDIRKYPFDEQKCNFSFMPWMTTKRYLYITSSIDTMDITLLSPHGEFAVATTPVEVIYSPTSYVDDDLMGVVYTVVLKRRPTFYWLIMIFPMITFPLLCPISFLVPTECGEKITLSITVVLSFMVFIGSMSDAMPKLSDTVSLLVVYSSIQTAISMLTVVANSIIICVSCLPLDFTFKRKQKLLQDNSNSMNMRTQVSDFTKANNLALYDFGTYNDTTTINKTEKTQHWIGVARKMDKVCFASFMSATIIVSGVFAFLIF